MLQATALALALLQASTPTRDALAWLAEARQHFERQDWAHAGQAARNALELDPRLGDAEALLGLVSTAQASPLEAEKHFLNAVALQPRNPRVHAYLGSTYLQLKRLPEARRAFDAVLRLDPGNLSARYNLGLLALLDNKPAEALPQFERVHAANPKDVPALIGVLESQLLLKKKEQTAVSAKKLEALLDASDPRLFQAATLLAAHGEHAAAIPIFERVRQASPGSREAGYNLALAYLKNSQLDQAASALQPLLDGPAAAEAFNLLGEVEAKRGRGPEAAGAFRRAAELEPANEDYRFDVATALLQVYGGETALPAFEACVRDFPNSWRMRLGLASSLYLAGKHEPSALALLEAIRLEPAAKEAYYLLGHAYEAAASLQPEIARAFQAYVGRRPDDPWAYYHYGTILYLRAQSEGEPTGAEARANLTKALELKPDFAEAYVQLGMIAETDEEAVKALGRAVRLNPQLASAHYRLGLAYQRLGEAEKAKAEMDWFRKLRAESDAAEKERLIRSLAEQKK
jgi:tetratricopeptide (TPR) repeat protein